jgi:hypothetical protein
VLTTNTRLHCDQCEECSDESTIESLIEDGVEVSKKLVARARQEKQDYLALMKEKGDPDDEQINTFIDRL